MRSVGQSCPCCGAEMKREETEAKATDRCPSCGLSDVRLKT